MCVYTHTRLAGAREISHQILRGRCTPGGIAGFSCIPFETGVLLNYPLGPCDVAGTQCSLWPYRRVRGCRVSESSLMRRARSMCPCPSSSTSQPRGRARNSLQDVAGSETVLPFWKCYFFFLLLQKPTLLVHFKLPLILNGGFSAPWILLGRFSLVTLRGPSGQESLLTFLSS